MEIIIVGLLAVFNLLMAGIAEDLFEITFGGGRNE